MSHQLKLKNRFLYVLDHDDCYHKNAFYGLKLIHLPLIDYKFVQVNILIVYTAQQMSKYRDSKSSRTVMLVEHKKLIEANTMFSDKFQFLNIKNQRLRTLLYKRLNRQHQFFENPKPTKSRYQDFVQRPCVSTTNGARASSPVTIHLFDRYQNQFHTTPVVVPTKLAGLTCNLQTASHPTFSDIAFGFEILSVSSP